MKFRAVNELGEFSFDGAAIQKFLFSDGVMEFTLSGALVKPDNSQNARFQDMYCGEIILQLENVRIGRLVKEGLKYFDADGKLLREIPDEDVPEPAVTGILKRIEKGTIFTTVIDSVESGYACEFGIDVSKVEDEEDVDTFWLCVLYDRSVAEWDRYMGPAE